MRRILYLLMMTFICQTVSGQTTDNELWTGGDFNLKINKKWRAGIAEQLRFNNNISSLKQAFTEVGAKFKINKYLAVATAYRFVGRPQKNNKNRISIDFLARYKKKGFPLSFGYRFRLQRTVTSVSQKSQSYIRNKFLIGYNLSKLVDPFVAYELYYRPSKSEFRVTRLTLGLDWKINKRINISSYYRIQNDINVKNPAKQNIIGVMFSYNTSWKKLTKNKSKASI